MHETFFYIKQQIEKKKVKIGIVYGTEIKITLIFKKINYKRRFVSSQI